MNKHLLSQVIRDPTRINNILDLILVNRENGIRKYECVMNEELSDHNTVMVSLDIYPGIKKSVISTKEYYDTDLYIYYMEQTPDNEENWLKYEKLMNECDWNSPAANDLNSYDDEQPPDWCNKAWGDDNLTTNNHKKKHWEIKIFAS